MSAHLTVNIDNMLKNLSSSPSKPSIFRVGDHLRSINPKAYDPVIIAIGPFHRGNEKLHNMEQHKVRYLKLFLERCGESSVERYVTAIRHLEDEARKCYAEDIQLDQDEFVQMLILDGCFIIEFLLKLKHGQYMDEDDPIFQYEHKYSTVLHDLMLFENQIPFLIIESLFRMMNNEDKIDSLIWPLLLNGIFPVQDLPEFPSSNAHHLLGIVHHISAPLFTSRMVSNSIDLNYCPSISSAVELEKAGISFQMSEHNHEFHIEFENKAMKISALEIFDSTESLFQNLIAYEHYYCKGVTPKYVSDYVFFMHCLVRSPEDAEVLRRSGIIYNSFWNNEMVYRVINQLGKNITISRNFPYYDIFFEVNHHCDDIRNTWMATLRTWMETLRRVYFSSPWTAISVFAAITLLVLTITQTTFAILSYGNDLKKGN